MSEDKTTLTEEERAQIQKDMEDARKTLVSEDVESKIRQAKEEAKKEVEKELQMKAELEKAKAEAEELRKKNEEAQKQAATQLDALKKRVDEMTASRAPTSVVDPFGNPSRLTDGSHPIDSLNDAEIDKLEERSAREFFGEDYDRMRNNL